MPALKLAVNPVPDFRSAPRSVRAAYLTLAGMVSCWVVAHIVGLVENGNAALFAGALLVGYLAIDSGLVLLRGRSYGAGLVRVWAAAAVVFAALITADTVPYASEAIRGIFVTTGGFGVVTVALTFLPSVRTFRVGAEIKPGVSRKSGPRTISEVRDF
jgi:hypothetical protein